MFASRAAIRARSLSPGGGDGRTAWKRGGRPPRRMPVQPPDAPRTTISRAMACGATRALLTTSLSPAIRRRDAARRRAAAGDAVPAMCPRFSGCLSAPEPSSRVVPSALANQTRYFQRRASRTFADIAANRKRTAARHGDDWFQTFSWQARGNWLRSGDIRAKVSSAL